MQLQSACTTHAAQQFLFAVKKFRVTHAAKILRMLALISAKRQKSPDYDGELFGPRGFCIE